MSPTRERQPSSPSLDEHHDGPGYTLPEYESVMTAYRDVLRRVEVLERRANSEAPGTVDVRRSEKGWRVRAPQWIAVALAVIALAALALWKAETLVTILK